MLEERLVAIIESRADEIARTWYRDVKGSNYTPGFRNISEDEGLEMATNVYRKLGYWLTPDSDKDVKHTYEMFGESLYNKEFRMEEVVMVLVLIKRYLWLHLLEQGIMTTNLEVYRALELNNKVVLYFDRAICFALEGYNNALERDK